MIIKPSNSNEPVWRDIHVHSVLPKELLPMNEIAHNLWWVWNEKAKDIFKVMDPECYEKNDTNPVALLQNLSKERTSEIINDKELMAKVDEAYKAFKDYMAVPFDKSRPSIAYFSMEYGLTHVLKIYSGGLGVLAGDFIKEASDSRVDMTAVGFLYRQGYFTQSLSTDGQQIANYENQNFGSLPITQVMEDDETPMVLKVPFHDRIVYSYVWKVAVGRMNLYLLDTDVEQNSEYDRFITYQLYGGDWENRMKQEFLLGVGGVLLLNKLGIEKDVYHMNEGHAAFISAQRLLDYITNENLSFNEALEVVRASTLYTVHTPVPAGHDYFDESLMHKYMAPMVEKLGVSWQEFMDMGRETPGSHEKFSMSVFALNTAQEANGVSKLHGTVSQEMFQPVWKGYFPEELHVGYVTNGIHLPTWATSSMKRLYEENFDKTFYQDQSNPDLWQKIYKMSDDKVWAQRIHLKRKLVEYIKTQFTDGWLQNQADPERILTTLDKINPESLIVGFSRRFATYKRAHLLFSDLERLERLLNNPDRPITFLFAGKAHPADGGGQGLIKNIVEISRRPEFLGKIIFLENYDMRLGKRLISGVDIWLNTPTRRQEASGTSGEKAIMNGVLNFSVKDGWWYEGYTYGAGWALTEHKVYENQTYQDQLDASTIYSMFESEIAPLYYDQNEDGVSPKWIEYIKNSIAQIGPRFNMKRMMDDYFSRFYNKLGERSKEMNADDFSKAKRMAQWKRETAAKWDQVEVVSAHYDPVQEIDVNGKEDKVYGEVVIDKKDLKADLGVEVVMVDFDSVHHKTKFLDKIEMELVKTEGSKLYFQTKQSMNIPGTHQYSFRVYPKNSELPHRMDFAYVKWFS